MALSALFFRLSQYSWALPSWGAGRQHTCFLDIPLAYILPFLSPGPQEQMCFHRNLRVMNVNWACFPLMLISLWEQCFLPLRCVPVLLNVGCNMMLLGGLVVGGGMKEFSLAFFCKTHSVLCAPFLFIDQSLCIFCYAECWLTDLILQKREMTYLRKFIW